MATLTTYKVRVIENCRVSPLSVAADVTKSIPLSFLDLIWIPFHPIGRVLFYDLPHSTTTHFTQTLVPNLKNSLSLVLKHFYPLAGNLIMASGISSTTQPQIRYSDGDSVSLTFAECSDNDYISGIHNRDADVLLPLVPKLPPASSEGDCFVTPVLAVQVTLFPNHGICIGIASSHVVADGRSMFNFIRTWASIAKQLCSSSSSSRDDNYDALFLEGLPFHDRSVIPRLANRYTGNNNYRSANVDKDGANTQSAPVNKDDGANSQSAPVNKVRATFIIDESNIQRLKNLVSAQRPTLAHISSFTAVSAYLWTCMAKTRAATGEGAHDADEIQHFGFPMDCRARLDPPIPATYFGNCLVPCLTTMMTAELVGEQGFVTAAELIGKAIRSRVQQGVLNGADKWHLEFEGVIKGEWTMGVAGSPNFDYYNKIDFGWGKAKKFEFVEEPLSSHGARIRKGTWKLG